LVAVAGCENELERRELLRDKHRLEERQRQLRQALEQVTAGKATLTEEEKARAGPLYIELRGVEANLADVNYRLRALD
jgi:hypothetical protein